MKIGYVPLNGRSYVTGISYRISGQLKNIRAIINRLIHKTGGAESKRFQISFYNFYAKICMTLVDVIRVGIISR